MICGRNWQGHRLRHGSRHELSGPLKSPSLGTSCQAPPRRVGIARSAKADYWPQAPKGWPSGEPSAWPFQSPA